MTRGLSILILCRPTCLSYCILHHRPDPTTRDLTASRYIITLSISYDDPLSCSHLSTLTESMTCIIFFLPSYLRFFPFFVCVPSQLSYICACLSPFYIPFQFFSLTAKLISRLSHILFHVHDYIPFQPLPTIHVSRATFPHMSSNAGKNTLDLTRVSLIPHLHPHSHFPHLPLPPPSACFFFSWLPKTTGYNLVILNVASLSPFYICTYTIVTLPAHGVYGVCFVLPLLLFENPFPSRLSSTFGTFLKSSRNWYHIAPKPFHLPYASTVLYIYNVPPAACFTLPSARAPVALFFFFSFFSFCCAYVCICK
ncbi:hypothetical protein BJV74DRAFT_413330 [Russula compacta]|nr:hypothetical protein BJV74DRAFT_413330 [Russula compacta]